ncbi:TetR family transcriptional regulator [Paraburkholderia unamae]|uniref:TetR/AcrR family transcriptional regulator n=1 Tax=Paraburkholderia unamae TaxID=219649 RepID=UPI000DC23452|nr:TetR/AcrR family transcriptional regulator [Paraburkholderia unamae]RAR56157.1 TetR family transcriptional regulator [Paraburkholderia unamae]
MNTSERKERGKEREARARTRHDQRERMLDAARRIVLRDGFAALSMRKIADAIGYSPASLYLYFEGRDEIAQALGREGYAQLLTHLEPCAQIADARERLHALAHAYVAFGCDQAQTYELIFMARKRRSPDVGPPARRARASASAAASAAASVPPAPEVEVEREADGGVADVCGATLFAATLAELTPASGAPADRTALAQALWATLHGVVMLTLAGFAPSAPGPLIDAALDAWFGAQGGSAALPASQTPGVAS